MPDDLRPDQHPDSAFQRKHVYRMAGDHDWGPELPTLVGDRSRLRQIRNNEASSLFEIFSDPEVMRYWSTPAMKDLQEAENYLDQIWEGLRTKTLFQWGITAVDEATVIGTVTLFNVDHAHERGELGYALARRSWGQGLATDALRTVARFAFDVLRLHRLEVDIDPRNVRSLRLVERVGFQREGVLREKWLVNGERGDAVILGLLRHELEAVD